MGDAMKGQLSAPSVIGNGTALIAVVLGGAFAIDWLAAKLGYQLGFTCSSLGVVSMLAMTAAMVLGTVGVVMSAISGFRDSTGIALLAGAILLGVLPGVFVQYLGRISAISCG